MSGFKDPFMTTLPKLTVAGLILLYGLALPARCQTTEASPLTTFQWIYKTTDQESIYSFFLKQLEFLKTKRDIFSETLSEVRAYDSSINMPELFKKKWVTEAESVKLAIAYTRRSLLRMGELRSSDTMLRTMAKDLTDFPADWQFRYFFTALDQARAVNSPAELAYAVKKLVESNGADSSGYIKDSISAADAAIALLHAGYPLEEKTIYGLLSLGVDFSQYGLLFYSNNSEAKLNYLNEKLKAHDNRPYPDRWTDREIFNILASFPEGRKRLEELRSSGKMVFLEAEGIYFGSINGAVKSGELEKNKERLRVAANYIKETNDRFPGKEKVLYVEITKDAEGSPVNWTVNSIHASHDAIFDTGERAMPLALLYAACGVRADHGLLNSGFGLGYASAYKNAYMDDLRLASRIGDERTRLPMDSPLYSEREWFAETTSAVIAGEKLSDRAQPALIAPRSLLSRSNNSTPR